MTLHDRLKNPTMEAAPVRRLSHAFPLAIALAVLAAGFAYAMPRLQNVSAEDPAVLVEATPSPTGSTHTTTATPSPSPTEDDEDDDGEKADNHGQVVSTAAHCDIKGKAHGELVRSIAHDKDATVADAEAACAAAIAAQEAAIDEPKSNNGQGHEDRAPKPDKGNPHDDDDDDSEASSDSDDDDDDSDDSDSDDSGSDDSDDSDSDDSGQGKGNGKP